MTNTNWKKSFFTIWTGQAISQITSGVLQMALIWYITFQTNSAAVLSLASIIAFLPQAILGPFIGVLIDRWDRKKIMILSDLFIAAVAGVLAVFGLLGEIPVSGVLVVLGIRSIGTAFHSPSLSAVTPLIVPENSLTKYAGYSQSLTSISLILSPALAAVLYANWSLPQIISIDIIGAIIASITVAATHIPKLERANTGKAERPHFMGEFKEGLKVLYAQKGLFYLLWIGVVFMVVFMPINALFPLMSLDYFGGTTVHASVAESVFAVGMLVGGLLLGTTGGFKNRIISFMLAIFIMGGALLISGFLPPQGFVVFAICCAIMGLTVPFYGGISTALYQEKIAPEYLGRVFSLSTSLMSLAMPIGLVFSGLFADGVGVNRWFFFSGIAMMGISFLCMLIPAVRKLDSNRKTAAPEKMQPEE
ncbi:MAG: MFS transporter [Christensenellaceae bacterium]